MEARTQLKPPVEVRYREELEALAKRVASDEEVRYCPHGRPVMIRFTRRQLEKMFGRIQ